jgi:hypothetical protein
MEATPNPTINNADLWAEYLEKQWTPWLGAGAPAAAEAFGAGIAALYTWFLGDFVTMLFSQNAAGVSRFVDDMKSRPPDAPPAEVEDIGYRTEPEWIPAWLTVRPYRPVAPPPPAREPVATT